MNRENCTYGSVRDKKFIILAVCVSLALFFTFSCSSDPDNASGTISSSRGGNVTIGTQIWMAKNLNSDVPGSKCYDDDPANCNTYGRLYDWATAMALPSSCNSSTCSNQINNPHQGICPSGWHIPNDDDWDVLMNSVGDSSTAGRYLKATNGWNNNGNGMDDYGFSALPGGRGYSDGSFDNVGDFGLWWSASEDFSYYAYFWGMDYDDGSAHWSDFSKDFLFSVRCLQD